MAARAAAPDKGAGLRPLRLRPQAEGTTAILSEMLARFIGDVRRNHALEHATVSLLISRLGAGLRPIGRAARGGLFLFRPGPGPLPSLSTLAVLGNGARKDRLGNAVLAGILAVTVAQPLGRLIQQHLTTHPDLAGMGIISGEKRGGRRRP